MHLRSQTPRSQRKQPAARTDVEKGFAVKVFAFEHFLKRFFGFGDARLVQNGQKRAPIPAELKPLAFCDFGLMLLSDIGIISNCYAHRDIRMAFMNCLQL